MQTNRVIVKVLLVLLATVAVALANLQFIEEWELWKKVHSRLIVYIDS